jgi:KipI family sensor histidine kinase inhibitor
MGDTGAMQARRVGENGLLVECVDVDEVAATYAALRGHAGLLGAEEIVPGARTVLLDGVADLAGAERLLQDLVVHEPDQRGTAEVEIPVTYDGPDLAEVALQWGVDPAEVVRIHTGTTFVVAFCGFAPGFAYCTGLPDQLTVRRRVDPRPRVPAGSVALAGEFTSVYPGASPGGWQLIGRCEVELWRPEHEQPALLAPGTRVRFVDG